MSACISRHGEFSEHQTDADFTCSLCLAFDEGAVLAEVVRLRAALDRVRALLPDWDANGNSRPLGDPTAEVWHKAATQLRAALEVSA